MSYQVNFGTVSAAASRPAARKTSSFRIALMGDFSGRANLGQLETGAALAARKPLRVDCDNLDDVIKRLGLKLTLPLGADGGSVEISIGSMDDFHPEQLHEQVSLFGELSGLRQRLKTSSMFAKAAQELQTWAGQIPVAIPATPARGSQIPIDGSLADFSQLLGQPSATGGETPIKELLRQMVGPYIVPAKDPRQDAMVAAVDEALSGTMRSILQHPDFQALEALWRSVDFAVRRLETDEKLQIVLYDISAEELAADLSSAEALDNSALYQLLVEQPAGDANQGPLAAIVGLYNFERTPPHAELLGRLAKIVAQAPAAFLTSIGSDVLDQNPKDLHPLIKDAWAALRTMPEAAYLGVAAPRFLLRLPYGEKTEPVDCFDFEEFSPKTGLRGMLWGNPAIIAGLLLGLTFAKQGDKMKLGTVLSVGEMPFYYFTDKDGDQVALPCTERFITQKVGGLLASQAFMPLVCMKGTPEVRLAGFISAAGRELAGPWNPVAVASIASDTPPPAAAPAPEPAAAPVAAAAAEPVAAPEPPPSDPELDALLADLGTQTETKAAEAAASDMDPDLAALLADLG